MENQIQRFNVLCVTKRSDRGGEEWHVPITGVAEVITSYCETLGVVHNAKTVVKFQGKDHKLLYVRSGLSGSSVTIAIERQDFPYNCWELYTDTPADDSSAETVRQIAQYEITHRRRS